jgi:predicted secreted protein
MQVTSALVLFAVIWFMVLFIALPIGLRTQGDEGERLLGTSGGSPAHLDLKRKLLWVTGISLVVWAGTSAVIISGIVTVDDINLYRVFYPDG